MERLFLTGLRNSWRNKTARRKDLYIIWYRSKLSKAKQSKENEKIIKPELVQVRAFARSCSFRVPKMSYRMPQIFFPINYNTNSLFLNKLGTVHLRIGDNANLNVKKLNYILGFFLLA